MKSVLVHAGLAVVGLFMAYRVWAGDVGPEARDDEVVVIDCKPGDLSSLRFKAPEREVKLTVDRKQGDDVYWIVSTSTPKTGKPTTQQFVGNKATTDYVKGVLPLRALRSLGNLNKKQLEEVELKDSKTNFEIACGGKKTKFLLGGSAYGSGDRYIRAASGGPVYLVRPELIRDVESAEGTLMQRDLHRFESTEIETLVVKALGRERTLMQRNRLDPRAAEWVDASAPDRRNELYGNWMKRVERLRVEKYLEPTAAPGSDLEKGKTIAPVSVMTLSYRDKSGSEIGRLELSRIDAEPSAYYARTEATTSWVTLTRSLAVLVQSDLEAVVGIETTESTSNGASSSKKAPGITVTK